MQKLVINECLEKTEIIHINTLQLLSDNKVLNALDPQNYTKSDQSDPNIIPFRKLKRAENIEKSTLSAL